MVAGVDHHRVPRREDRPQRADVRLVAGREHERGFGVEPLGQLSLELDMHVGRAIQEARTGQTGSVAVQRVERALLDALVTSQPEVVVGTEHDPSLALHLDHGQRRALEHVEVGQRVEFARDLEALEVFVLAGLGEDVDRGRHSGGGKS